MQINVALWSVRVSGIAAAYGNVFDVKVAYAKELLEICCDLQEFGAHFRQHAFIIAPDTRI